MDRNGGRCIVTISQIKLLWLKNLMKKIILTTIAAGCLSFSAFADSWILLNTDFFWSGAGVTTYGPLATDVNNATTWFTGNASYQVWYAALGTVSQAQLNAINAYNNVYAGGLAAAALLPGVGFSEVASGDGGNGSLGAGYYVANTDASGTVDLPGVPPNTSAYLAIVITDTTIGDGMTGWEGVLAFANNTGGNPDTYPPQIPAFLTGWDNLDVNLVLSPIPEPSTLALAGLGGLSLLLFRRQRK